MTDRARFITLGWQLLEHKCRYYVHSKPSIEDYAYDLLEKEYDTLAAQLGEPPSVSDMVDFDTKRPSCQRVMEKIALEMKPRKRRRKP
jgi:NAD-dependent DNA ligase